MNPDWQYQRRKYRRRLYLVELGKQLVHPYIAARTTRARTPEANAVIDEIQGNEPSTSTAPQISNLPNSQKLSHASPVKKRARCAKCEYKDNHNLVLVAIIANYLFAMDIISSYALDM